MYHSAGGGPITKLTTVPLTQSTNYVDRSVATGVEYEYYVRPVDGVAGEFSKPYVVAAHLPVQQFIEIPLQIPDPVQTSDGV